MTTGAKLSEPGSGARPATAAIVSVEAVDEFVVKVGGDWLLSEPVPAWTDLMGEVATKSVRILPGDLGRWDTSLVLFLAHVQTWCAESKCDFHDETLPENLLLLLRQITEAGVPKPVAEVALASPWALTKAAVFHWTDQVKEWLSFVGECTVGFLGAVRNPRRFRWLDCLVEMQNCWASSLPIVGLVSFLVGVILAFQAAVERRQFGAAIFVADLVGLAVVREMGPMMAAMIAAGGTGAGFAAQLGNMKLDEEIDALETLGISSVDFLALPRLLAATIMLPILVVYANVLGILGGLFVSATMLDIPASAYWIETKGRLGWLDVGGGLLKSVFFGSAVGLAGCLRGMRCERSAAGVGRATSSAAVTGMLLIVLADAVFALVFNALGI